MCRLFCFLSLHRICAQRICRIYSSVQFPTFITGMYRWPRVGSCTTCLTVDSHFVSWTCFGWLMVPFVTLTKRASEGIEPTAAAPSQPDCPGVSRSDHSVGSKESALWRALGLRSDWHGRLGVGKREKEGKEASGRGSQDEPAQDEERMVAERAAQRDKYRCWRKRRNFFCSLYENRLRDENE